MTFFFLFCWPVIRNIWRGSIFHTLGDGHSPGRLHIVCIPMIYIWNKLQFRAAFSVQQILYHCLKSKQSHWAVAHISEDKEVWPPQAVVSYLTDMLTRHKWWQLLFVSQQETLKVLHHHLMSRITSKESWIGDVPREFPFQVSSERRWLYSKNT